MNSNYTVKELLYAIQHKNELEDRCATTGNFDLLSQVMDAEIAVMNAGFTDRQMEAFRLYYVEDWTLAMIADKYNTTHQNIACHLSSCRKKLQKYLDREEEQC